jgi:hypothetical protein
MPKLNQVDMDTVVLPKKPATVVAPPIIPSLTLATIKAEVTAEYVEKMIRKKGSMKLEAIKHPYTDSEAKTWSTQLAEALAYRASATASTPLIDTLSVSRGLTKPILVDKIMENAALFSAASGTVLGQQQKFLDRLKTEDPKSLFDTILAW